MEPMKPIKPMAPISDVEHWWPEDLGQPSTSGSQNSLRYALFPDKMRLLTERDGKIMTYDSGNHRISGVAQQSTETGTLTFTSQNGTVDLGELRQLTVRE